MKKIFLNGFVLLVLTVMIGLVTYFSDISLTNKIIISILILLGLGIYIKNVLDQKMKK
ncbi:hypothetical protein [Pediococcus claussenii]|uniref:Membrane protein n=1 Tax=Pediococcus claussenii (strain ATCC BAA-344 / DSM 14800 / JCM 18046 / KCTC 3811 / LMG 21948 / P06) TaxID=701521 RepID=G8PDV5_PEDCP|nr:hypothetical protein [Pediococcus claussenii]AEV95440.1 putative membrane protein [Pediococcus claussenii ATCC BAA-344]KRN19082.1 hypothetical protein IV79_GL001744 [Pediococcus claussenii]